MDRARPTSSRAFTRFLKLTLGIQVKHRFKLTARNLETLTSLKPPYLLLPNHVSFWDPFFVAYFASDPVYWVTSDRQFRNRGLRFLLGLVGAIPKAKAMADLETVRNIFDVKNRGGIIGIFAEGRRNWDGHSLPLLYPTAKLAKALKIPVVVPILHGAFLELPRWARKRRKTTVTVEYRPGPTPAELAAMSVDEVYAELSRLVEYDEWEYQRERMFRLRTRERAEGLERVLFMCRSCRTIGSMRSHRHTFVCGSCGTSTRVDEYGFFDGDSQFATVREWNLWQLDELASIIDARRRAPAGGTTEALFIDGPVRVFTGYRTREMKPLANGGCALYDDRIEIIRASGVNATTGPVVGRDGRVIRLEELDGINLQNREQLEFYCGDRLYNLDFARHVSGYKWMIAIQMLRRPLNEPRPESWASYLR